MARALGRPLDHASSGLVLPDAGSYVVFLVDGLGRELLERHPEDAPYLSSLLAGSAAATAGVPSTTATSLTSLGTGLPPGGHGVVGYTARIPGTDRLLNHLQWSKDVDSAQWQPHPTIFGRLAAEGVATAAVNKREFHGSGLTDASSRGAGFVGADRWGERLVAVQAASTEHPSLTYVYDGDLDWTGHRYGVDSAQWRAQLAITDQAAKLGYGPWGTVDGLVLPPVGGRWAHTLRQQAVRRGMPFLAESAPQAGGVYLGPANRLESHRLGLHAGAEHGRRAKRAEVLLVTLEALPNARERVEGFMAGFAEAFPGDVVFHRVPMFLRPSSLAHQKLFYALQMMGLIGALHRKVFDAFFNGTFNGELDTPLDTIANFLAKNGVDRQKFLDTFNSFTVQQVKVREANRLAEAYGVNSTPTLAVGGRYVTLPAENPEQLLHTVDYLIGLARKKA